MGDGWSSGRGGTEKEGVAVIRLRRMRRDEGPWTHIGDCCMASCLSDYLASVCVHECLSFTLRRTFSPRLDSTTLFVISLSRCQSMLVTYTNSLFSLCFFSPLSLCFSLSISDSLSLSHSLFSPLLFSLFLFSLSPSLSICVYVSLFLVVYINIFD